MIEWVNAQELAADHVKAPPSQPVAKDERAGCKAWCGMDVNRGGVSALEALGYPFGGGERHPDALGTRWCSPVCRDAKHPPLPAPSPARPAVEVACASWCGKRYIDRSVPSRFDAVPIYSRMSRDELWFDDEVVWCSVACKTRALGLDAPAPSQPAETVKSCEHAGECRSTKCEPAKPATAAKCCQRCGKTDASVHSRSFDMMARLWCAMCCEQAWAWLDSQAKGGLPLSNPEIPERITAPKLAHQCFDDSTMPDGGR